MPSPKTTKKATTKKATTKPAAKARAKQTAKGMTLDEAMRALEQAGSEQTRKTYKRHGAKEPMFGVSFASLKTLVKRIGVDHQLAVQLWNTGNHDARILAFKVADPAQVKPAQLDKWTAANPVRAGNVYVAMLAAESPHGRAKAKEWLASPKQALRASAWLVIGFLASLDEQTSDNVFAKHIERIESTIHEASNAERETMNSALISIGGRSPALRKAATAAAKRIGKLEIDYGDTDCKTPDAVAHIEKMWAHAAAKKFDSPAAQERARESMRTRC
jgi:3-methyladenine DNA glycosylase AlkD